MISWCDQQRPPRVSCSKAIPRGQFWEGTRNCCVTRSRTAQIRTWDHNNVSEIPFSVSSERAHTNSTCSVPGLRGNDVETCLWGAPNLNSCPCIWAEAFLQLLSRAQSFWGQHQLRGVHRWDMCKEARLVICRQEVVEGTVCPFWG